MSQDLVRYGFRRTYIIRQTGCDSAAGHTVKLGRNRILDKYRAAAFLDGSNPRCSIRTGTGQNYTEAGRALVIRQGLEKEVDRLRTGMDGIIIVDMQEPVMYGHFLIGGDGIYTVGRHRHEITGLHHLHGGGMLEDFRQQILALRIHVLYHDESQAAVIRYLVKKGGQGFHPSGRGSDSNNGDIGLGRIILGKIGWEGFGILVACFLLHHSFSPSTV